MVDHRAPVDTARIQLDGQVAELYGELRKIARAALAGQIGQHTLQPTALVHEAWLRLSQLGSLRSEDRHQFLALAARTMRHVLVDHARGKQRLKRGGGALMLTWDPAVVPAIAVEPIDLIAFDSALRKLDALAPRQVEIVELRFLAGLSVEEVAALLALSSATIKREAALARAWILRELGVGPV
jgi:RNA polymerase sigma factor (TIGR02999 family)